ncbi:hypothetical protein BBL07_15840 [Agrobacterium vitis]|nr:hypothetical protein BBL07_15840 [Agrobacterium vitis]
MQLSRETDTLNNAALVVVPLFLERLAATVFAQSIARSGASQEKYAPNPNHEALRVVGMKPDA